MADWAFAGDGLQMLPSGIRQRIAVLVSEQGIVRWVVGGKVSRQCVHYELGKADRANRLRGLRLGNLAALEPLPLHSDCPLQELHISDLKAQ